MIKLIGENEIHLTRGDTGYLKPIIEIEREDDPGVFDPYEFQENDKVFFRMATNSKLVLEKEFLVDVENNKAVLTIEPEDTKSLEPRAYHYCIELVTASDKHFTFVEDARFELGKELERNE